MRRLVAALIVCSMALLVAMALLQQKSAQAGGTCPSPLPSCSTNGQLTELGPATYGCTEVGTEAVVVKSHLNAISPDGAGNFTGVLAGNKNDIGANTYRDFTPISGTYCVNTDNTGYLFPNFGTGCPITFVVAGGGTQIRLLDTSQPNADVWVCRKK